MCYGSNHHYLEKTFIQNLETCEIDNNLGSCNYKMNHYLYYEQRFQGNILIQEYYYPSKQG
jgi:hypothetical protein